MPVVMPASALEPTDQRSATGEPLDLLRARLDEVRLRVRQLHLLGEGQAGRCLFDEYREWLCPDGSHSDLLLMRRLGRADGAA